MAPPRGVEPPGPGPADGVPRDHPRRHRAGDRRAPRARPAPGRRAGDAPHPRPPLRLRDEPGPVEEGGAEAVGRSGPERGHPSRRRTGAGQDALPASLVLGRRGHLRAGRRSGRRCCGSNLRRDPRRPRRQPPGDRARLRRDRGAHPRRRRARRGRRSRAGGRPRRGGAGRPFGRAQALPPPASGSVHHLDAPAGGRAQARHGRQAGHGHRSAAVRERLHHLHADRLDDALRECRHHRTDPHPGNLRPPVRAGRSPHLREQGEERPGGPRGDPPRRRALPSPGRGGPRGRWCRGPPVRDDLAAHRRIADGRCRRRDADDAPRRRRSIRARRRVLDERHRHHVRRLPAGLRRGSRRCRRC